MHWNTFRQVDSKKLLTRSTWKQIVRFSKSNANFIKTDRFIRRDWFIDHSRCSTFSFDWSRLWRKYIGRHKPGFTSDGYFSMYRIGSQSVETSFFYRLDFNDLFDSHFRYKTQFFQYLLRALTVATKLSLRIDGAGILCAQFLIYTERDKPSLVEYFVSCDSSRWIVVFLSIRLDLVRARGRINRTRSTNTIERVNFNRSQMNNGSETKFRRIFICRKKKQWNFSS